MRKDRESGKSHRAMVRLRAFCALLVSIALFAEAAVPAQAVTKSELESSIKQKESAISEAKSEKKKIQSSLSDIKSMVGNLQASKNNLEAYVTQLDSNLEEIQNRIEELKNLITDKEGEIEQAQADLDAALEKEEAQYEAMKVRIQYSYEQKETDLLSLLFTAKGFKELLNRTQYIEQMNNYDQEQMEEYTAARQLVEVCKQELESEHEVLEEARLQVEEEEKNLETLIKEKEKEIEQYRQEIADQQAAIKEYESYIAEQNAQIAALEAAAAAEKKQLEEMNKPQIHFDGGMFCLPLATYTRISDDYGNRIHPILKTKQFHNGIDFAAPGGTAIYAAYKGTVVAAAYNASMGNYVMINHGDGIYTVYMHASKLYVSTGKSVNKGDKIAAVGTTGRSTGNHLHFSVRKNGSYVNPWGYLR